LPTAVASCNQNLIGFKVLRAKSSGANQHFSHRLCEHLTWTPY